MELTKRRKRGSCWQLPSTLPLCRNEYPFSSHSPTPKNKNKKNPTNKKALTIKLKRQSRRRKVTWRQPSLAAHLTASEFWECHRDLALPSVCRRHSWGVYVGTIRAPSLALQSVLSNFRLSHTAEPRHLRLGGHGMWQLHCQSLARPTKGNEALKSHLHWCLVAQTRSFPESARHALVPFCSTLKELPVESLTL